MNKVRVSASLYSSRIRGLSQGLLAVLATVFLCVAASAQAPVHKVDLSGAFIREWLLCGPFPNPPGSNGSPDAIRLAGLYTDYLAAHGGETDPRIAVGQVETFEGGSATWVAHKSDTDAIDLDHALSEEAAVVAYAYCELEADTGLACLLAVGSNDGSRLWLNGEPVFDHPGGRGLKVDDDLIPVVLRAGRNTLLMKVEERGNKWGLTCRVLPFNHNLSSGKVPLFDVITREDGVPVLHFMQSQSLLGKVIQKADLQVFSSAAPAGETVWSQPWTLEREMPIGVHASAYGEFRLKIALALAGGIEDMIEMPFTAGKRVDYTVFDNGKTDYAIVVGAEASESEKWVAKELQTWLKEASGADFPIRDDSGPAVERAIVVGFNKHAQAALGGAAAAPADADESFTYQNAGATILIYGGKQRGTQYGVMSFLERELGCRWYTPSVSAVPKKTRFGFHYLQHSEKPGIRVRNDFYFEAFEPIWAARNRINGAMNYREQPGGIEAYWSVHTFYPLMPPTEFFETHPEYYSLIEGKRRWEHAQLCLTNPDVLRIIVERIKKVMREKPEYLIYDVSQNDWSGPCQCDTCAAIVKQEGSESGPIIWFVNQVAEQVQAEFPDKFIGTLAYSYTRKPCATLRPRDNVVVRFCSIECCFAHDFRHCPENESFVRDMEGWAKIAPHLYIWDYVVNFSHYILPYPNFRVLQPNIQFFREHNAIGIMEQAAYQSRGGEFAELRAYVIAKLLWNPDGNVEEAINNFMYGYYGRAGQYVRAYFDLLHNRLTPDTHIHLGLPPDDPLFTDEFVRQAEAVFDQAEGVADNEAIRQRVEVARLPIMYLKCKRSPSLAKRDGTYARFTAITEREGITHYAEAGQPHRDAFHAELQSAE